MHQAGLLDHSVDKARIKDSKNPCSLESKNKVAQQRHNQPILLKLSDFCGSFVILGTGIGLALVAIIVELLIVTIFRR